MVLWWNVLESFEKLSPKTMKFNLEKILCGILCCLFMELRLSYDSLRFFTLVENSLALSTTFTSESSIVPNKSSSSFFLRQRPSHNPFSSSLQIAQKLLFPHSSHTFAFEFTIEIHTQNEER